MNPTVLMLSPFLRAQRGNSITVNRISSGLRARGWNIELFSTEGVALQDGGGFVLPPYVKLIHGFNASYTGMFLRQIPELAALPLLLTMTGTDLDPTSLRANADSRLALQSCAAAVVFHQDFIQPLASALPIGLEKILCIPQGVALPPLSPAAAVPDRRAGEVRLLLPSGLRAVKDIMLALDAFAQLKPRYPELSLYIAGCAIEPDYSQSVQNRVNALSDTEFLGEIPYAQMPAFYAAGDMVINCSVFEGQPQAALEAMSLGRPALLRAVPGNLNTITHGREGYYFDTVETLAARIAELTENPALRHTMGRSAKQLVAERYNVQDEIDAYDRLYKAVDIH